MATKRMLIDASHPEETRVVVVSGNRVEDFDVEVESRLQLKGNVYLAKVTRVEPSLQAAFVEYGGNRHGFLAFSEIHPDYYQIPVADREALLAEEETAQRAAQEAADAVEDGVGEGAVEELGGGEDDIEEAEKVRRPTLDHRKYKIQEVIKRRQILLVQVVKEERGNKGAALTTYLSLAGRYCVLMPNTARGGGISRKIALGQDRKRLKTILADLGIPDGMAVIVRTAGAKRTKAEIKRDYEYLIRLWEQIRQKTLESIAPASIHEEGNLIKRSIRDIYSKEIEEVIVDGEEGYRTAKDFMRLMMPSHAKRVQPYKDTTIPLLQRFQVENQIDSMHSPEVHMKSGGYIVINSTEALVAIDVNSGRSTKERNIEETALRTNLEAADEIARQLRLRDLAGLIVIDFIDMENHRNQSRVERAVKDAMRNDRARIQIGRISPFGLLEMSRQRLRPSLQEMHSEPCPHCGGTGVRRSADTTALQILRAVEEEAMRRRTAELVMHVPTDVALYILNHKRDLLLKMEADYEIKVFLENDDTLIPPDYRMDRVKSDGTAVDTRDDEKDNTAQDSDEAGRKKRRRRGRKRGRKEDETPEVETEDREDAVANDDEPANVSDGDETTDEAPRKPRRRRRGRRAGRRRNRENGAEENVEAAEGENTDATEEASANTENNGDGADTSETTPPATSEDTSAAASTSEAVNDEVPDTEPAKPKRQPRRRRSKTAKPDAASEEQAAEKEPASEISAEASSPASDKPASDTEEQKTPSLVEESPQAIAAPVEAVAQTPDTSAEDVARTTVIDVSELSEKEKPAKKGWWRRG